MIEIDIPGFKILRLNHLVLDYNGTLACDGKLLPGVQERLRALSDELSIHVLTADTFGQARTYLDDIPCEVSVIAAEYQEIGKLTYVNEIGAQHSVCIGNGRNDRLMLKEAALGIAVILEEGAAIETLLAADVVCTGIVPALDLLRRPLRLTATMRS
ncbi:MAG: ATPase P [Desulfobacterales bacterium]|nr:MAG: ATPase P [Desulfobacterales bacterium]